MWNDFAAYAAMSGHGIYVWASYGISLIVLTGLVLYLRRNLKRALDLI